MTLEAGPELDALIAAHVMGLEDVRFGVIDQGQAYPEWSSELGSAARCAWVFRDCKPDGGYEAVPAYSTDIAAAWTVVEKLIDEGHGVAIMSAGSGSRCAIDDPTGIVGHRAHESVELAICLAALAAMEGGEL